MSELQPSSNPAESDPKTPWEAPYPGSKQMPRWETGVLPPPPTFSIRHLPFLVGPGLVMGAAAVGGGEWLTGPYVTGQYGGALLWLATLSIFGQVLYNIEISRYTLYTGEPIFTGKFRIFPGPIFWLLAYLLVDIGSFLPYLSANAAVPLFAMVAGHLPDPEKDAVILKVIACGILLVSLSPLAFGGKVYSSLKYIMSAKLVIVIGFLLFLAFGYSTWDTWREIITGFFRFGTLPYVGVDEHGYPLALNPLVEWWNGREVPHLNLAMIGLVTAMAAIAGNGGLTNSPISNYTRDQGWGMGKEVGAISSIVGGQDIKLSHVGKVFQVTQDSLKKFGGWLKHVQREQVFLWLPACFLGMALPSMLSVQFLERGGVPSDPNLVAAMTADGVATAVGPAMGPLFWKLTLFCGFLVLATSSMTTAEGALRRWVDVFWTASPQLRKWEPHWIGRLFFGTLVVYALVGLLLLNFQKPIQLLIWTTTFYNYALGMSCFHVVAVNHILLPKQIRPGIFRTSGLIVAGLFYTLIAIVSTRNEFVWKPRLEAEKAAQAQVVPVEESGAIPTGIQQQSLSEQD